MERKIIKADYFALISLLFILSVSFFFFKDNIFNPYSDIGREIYIPSEILRGTRLYKDITVEFPPLGYLSNALILKIFGLSLDVLKYVGLILSFVIMLGMYKITRLYTDIKTAFSLCCLFIFACVCYQGVSNYFTPYSYSVLYALVSAVWCVCFLLKFNIENSVKYLYYSSFLYGFSVCCKYEFVFLIFPVIISFFIKKIKINDVIKCILCSVTVPSAVVFYLTVNGVGIGDFMASLKFISVLSKNLVPHYQYWGILPGSHTLEYIKSSFSVHNFQYMFYTSVYINFIFMSVLVIKKRFDSLFILTVCAFVMSVKSIGGIVLMQYGTFFLPVILISLTSFLFNYLKKLNILIYPVFIILSVWYCLNDIYMYDFKPLKTDIGKINTFEEYNLVTSELIEYLKNETDSSEEVLIIPEGTIINVISGRKSHNKLYNLCPPNYKSVGEKYVNNIIDKKEVKYIVLTNIPYLCYKMPSFSNLYGRNTYNEIIKNYDLKKTIGDDFVVKIYERKQ